MTSLSLNKLKKRPASLEVMDKPKKKINRFDGKSEEEVRKYTLPDILEQDLDIVFVGINPSLMAACKGRYYAGPGNHFYKLLSSSGLVPRPVTFEDDLKLLDFKIGLTNIVERATRSSSDLRRTEIQAGAKIIQGKLEQYKPRIAVFNGKGIFEIFANKSANSEFQFGLQGERIGNTAIWVVPSSSARCANFPRMVDKLHFYRALKKYLSFIKGEIKDVNYKEFCFEGKCKPAIPTTSKMWRRKEISAFQGGGRVVNKDTINMDTLNESVSAVIRSSEFTFKGSKSEIEVDSGRPESSGNFPSDDQALDGSTGSELESDKEVSSNIAISISDCDEMKQSTNSSSEDNTSVKSNTPEYTSKTKVHEKPTLRFSIDIRKNCNTSINFVNLINQRLLAKEQKENEDINVESDCPTTKGLNYANLFKNNNHASDFFIRKFDSDSDENICVDCD